LNSFPNGLRPSGRADPSGDDAEYDALEYVERADEADAVDAKLWR